MPIWVLVAAIYSLAMGVSCSVAFRASRRGRALYGGWLPFRASIGAQAERWLHAQNDV